MSNNDFIPFHRPSISKEEENAVLSVLKSAWLTTGARTLEFEAQFAKMLGVKHALAVNSATSGLLLAMKALGVSSENKIITTPYTFISTASTALLLGAKVVYCDIEKSSYSIDCDKIEKTLESNKNIRAIVPVHIAGNPCNMQKIMEIAKKFGVFVIEDCAHAFPSLTKDGYCGTLGDIGVFSFYATKTITTAEGGMVVTNNDAIAEKIKTLRMHGIDRNVWDRYTSEKASFEYDVKEIGYKCNLPDILSAIGIEQLKKSNIFYEKRKKIAEKYNKAFSPYDFFALPPSKNGNAWHLYLLRLNLKKLTINRNEFAKELQNCGVGISMHFIPHYHFTMWKNNPQIETYPPETNFAVASSANEKSYANSNDIYAKIFPNAEEKYLSTISLPIWPGMTEKMVQKVIKTVISTGKKYER